jgi:hypothetical protein
MLYRKSQLFLRKIFLNEPQRAQRAQRKRIEIGRCEKMVEVC